MKKFVGSIVAIIITTTFFLQSCGFENKDIAMENNIPVINTVGDIITNEYDVVLDLNLKTKNYSNPKGGKYYGAYIENAIYNGSIEAFEKEMGEHSMYVYDFNINDLDEDLLISTIDNCILNGAIPYIILTSNSVVYDMKIEDIEELAVILENYDYPIILELLPYQFAHNYNVDLYKLFYIQAYDIIKSSNEKVDIAFPLVLNEIRRSKEYMPIKQYYDYVALRLDVDATMPLVKMMYLMDEGYQMQYDKPKVVNVAISHYDTQNSAYYSEDALEKFTELYTKMDDGYENIVSINYMDYPYNPKMPKPYDQRYTLNGIPKIAQEYRVITSGSAFLNKMQFTYDNKAITTFKEKAIKVNDKVYIPESIVNDLGMKVRTNKINGDKYVELTNFANKLENENYYLILDEENGKINIVEKL